jgi:hypothetical protein
MRHAAEYDQASGIVMVKDQERVSFPPEYSQNR